MTPAERRLLRRLIRRRLPPIRALTGSQFRALVARLSREDAERRAVDRLAGDLMRAASRLENDHETEVPRGEQDHDGPAAREGQDSGGPL